MPVTVSPFVGKFSDGRLLALVDSGPWVSTDGGKTWNPAPDGTLFGDLFNTDVLTESAIADLISSGKLPA